PRQPVGERLQRELLADVQDEPLARVLDGVDAAAQRVTGPAAGVLTQGLEAIAVVDDVVGAVGEAGDVAQPQPGELEAVVERAGPVPSASASAFSPSPSDSRAQARAVSASTPRSCRRAASSSAVGASKRTCWQREAIVGITLPGRSVKRTRCANAGGSSSVL